MNNSIASLADAFMPPKPQSAPKKSSSTPLRQPLDYTGSNERPQRPERPDHTNHKTSTDDQVSNDNNGKKRDFNEVLAKKMSKRDTRTEKKEETKQDSHPEATESPKSNLPITEAELADKVTSTKTTALLNLIKDNQADKSVLAESQKPQHIIELANNPAASTESIGTQGENAAAVAGQQAAQTEKIAAPTDAGPETGKEAAAKTNAIPIKTPENNSQVAKINSQDTQQANNTTDQPVQKTQQEVQASNAVTTKPVETEQTEQTKQTEQIKQVEIAPQAAKAEQKPVAEQLENIPKSDLKNKFEQSLERSNSQATSQNNTAANTETDTLANKNVVQAPVVTVTKDIHNTLTDKSSNETASQTLNQISSDAGIKTNDINAAKANSTLSSTSSSISQITEHIRASSTRGQDQITIALDPPELGRVMIKFQQRNGEIVGLVEAEKAKTHQEIANEMPQIIKALNDSGIAVKRIEVVLTEQNTQNTSSDNSANHNNNTGRQTFHGGSDNPENQNSNNPSRNYSSPYNPAINPDNYINNVSDGAINMFA